VEHPAVIPDDIIDPVTCHAPQHSDRLLRAARNVSTRPNLTEASTNKGSAATARRKYFSASTSILAAGLGWTINPKGARAVARAVSSASAIWVKGLANVS
jgi:hypothetical protein